MPELRRPGALINYEVWGDDGAPLAVLVNGHTRPLNDFRLLGRSLVERGRRVAALDNRGAGRTTHDRPFTVDDMAADVAALIAELGEDVADVLGISMGGFVAQTLVLSQPARVRQLALVSTAPHQRSIRSDDRAWSTDPAAVEAKLRPYFTADFARRNEMLVRSMAKQIAKSVQDGDYQVRAEAQKAAVRGFDSTARLGGVRAPTLIVHGDEDEIIPFAAGEELARGIPGARLARLDGAGHLLLAERPKELYALVGEHFGA